MAHFSPDFIQFFIELATNNHKEWFDTNRNHYQKVVKEATEAFLSELIQRLSEEDERYQELEPRDCMFRINRDIRFSKDKQPYKLFTSAILAPGGKKGHQHDGVYIELGPEFLSIYSGVYAPEREELHAIRSYMANHGERFNYCVEDHGFKETFGEIQGEKNKVLPKELHSAAKDNPWLFNKQWYVVAHYSSTKLLDEDLVDFVLKHHQQLRDFTSFFSDALKENSVMRE